MSRWEFKQWKNLTKLPVKTKVLLLFLVGMLLLVAAFPTGKQNQSSQLTDSVKETDSGAQSQTDFMDTEEYLDYEKLLENRMQEALEEVNGVGHVSVMITLKSSSEQVIEKDVSSSTQSSGESSENSAEKTSIYNQNADGSQQPYVKKVYAPQVEGVIVVAEGADDQVVVQNITEAVQALFGVEAHKIKIMKRRT